MFRRDFWSAMAIGEFSHHRFCHGKGDDPGREPQTDLIGIESCHESRGRKKCFKCSVGEEDGRQSNAAEQFEW